MSKNKLQEAEKILEIVRLLLEIVKDETIPESEADKTVGQLLVKLDIALQKYDHPDISNIKDRIEIEQPVRKTSKSKGRK
jgi:hypothetical protein